MLWSESPRAAALATPPKDQVVMKLDTEGRLKQLWMVTGEVNWIHSIAVAADGSVYFGEVQGKRPRRFVPAGSTASAH